MEQTKTETGWRGSADLWLNAAYELLLEQGVDAVKILPLAQKLNLARTSFYWFFEDREALLKALLGLWREKNTGNLVKQANAYAETIVEAVLNVTSLWFDSDLFDSRFEFAVRSWALQSPDVLAEVKLADHTRLSALNTMFLRYGFEPEQADVQASAVYLVQIGYISMQTVEDQDFRMQRVPRYVKVFTGKEPSQRALARFYARHNYEPGLT